MTALTLPGSIPGLLRLCSPVLHGDTRGVVCLLADPDVGAALVTEIPGDGRKPAMWLHSLTALALDLTDATGRAHAAWWLHKQQRGAGYPYAETLDVPLVGDLRHAFRAAVGGLQDDDPQRLPDGSRWVDAEALRRVCLHVAGLEVA